MNAALRSIFYYKNGGRMVDLDKAKQRLLDLKQEYQTRVHKIQHDMQNPDTDMTQDWDDQAVIKSKTMYVKTC